VVETAVLPAVDQAREHPRGQRFRSMPFSAARKLLQYRDLIVDIENSKTGLRLIIFGVTAQVLTPIEWKVPTTHSLTICPTIWPTRSFISRAALLVKVTERISDGQCAAETEDMGNAGGQHPGLAGAGTRQHQ